MTGILFLDLLQYSDNTANSPLRFEIKPVVCPSFTCAQLCGTYVWRHEFCHSTRAQVSLFNAEIELLISRH